jgi:hypothetical protein
MTTELLINKDVSKADETFMTNVFLNAENEISDFLELPDCSLHTRRLLPLIDCLPPLSCPCLLPSEEVSLPKTINIKQYLNTSNFSVNNRYFVIKSKQATQLDITK